MRKYAIAILFILAFCMESNARIIFNINRDWKFFPDVEASSDVAMIVNLPHMWNYDALGGSRDYARGIGNYQKEIDIPSEWRNKRVFIKCYGANSVTDIMVNGKHVGEHRGGYTAFAFEITDNLLFGKRNFFRIMVNNSQRTDVLPTAGDANSYGGLFRDVEIIVTEKDAIALTDYGSSGIYISQKLVTREKIEAEAIVKINGIADNTVTAELTATTPWQDTVARKSVKIRLNGKTTSTAKIPFEINSPVLWNGINDPFLYDVSVKIINGKTESDAVRIRTGFRYVSVDSQGNFLLNGLPYQVKGVVVTQDRAMVGTAIKSYQVQEDIDLIIGMGANAVRVAGVCHNPEFYELCDRKGILVWSDFPLVGAAYLTDRPFNDMASFSTNGLLQATEITRQQFNHPSVVMWGIFSELWMKGDNPIGFIYELNKMAKTEDPSRLTVAASNEDGEINFITDLIVWDHFFGWKEGLPSDIEVWAKQFHSNWKNLRSGISYSAGASIYHQEDSLYRPQYTGNWHPERWQTKVHEDYYSYLKTDKLFWGVFVGNMFDYGAASRSWGEGNGINDCGLVTFDRKYRKDAYYFYKANWNSDDPFVYISERRWDKRKNKIQDVRVFSNCTEVELFVNGLSHGVKNNSVNGQFIWNGVLLNYGENELEVRSGEYSDLAFIVITDQASAIK